MLQVFGNKLDKIQLQKLLFLHSRYETKKKTYDFVPYKYGCFSFQANADLKTLKKYGIVDDTKIYWSKTDDTNYLTQLNADDKKIVSDFSIIYKDKSSRDLIKLTYNRYPYYAINSIIAEKHLSRQELKKIDNLKSIEIKTTLFTIGYEGISFEHYLNKLIRNNIKVLCDVRKNALSMKYGFSKTQLKTACESLGITYIHIPEVGISSDKRKELKTSLDDQLAQSNKLSKEIGMLYKQGLLEQADEKKELVSSLKDTIVELESEFNSVKSEIENHLFQIPNLPHQSVKIGA